MTKSELKQLIKECVIETFNEDIEAPWVSNPDQYFPKETGYSESDATDYAYDEISNIFKKDAAVIPIEEFWKIHSSFGENNPEEFDALIDDVAEKYEYIYDKTVGENGAYVKFDAETMDTVLDPVLKRWVLKK